MKLRCAFVDTRRSPLEKHLHSAFRMAQKFIAYLGVFHVTNAILFGV